MSEDTSEQSNDRGLDLDRDLTRRNHELQALNAIARRLNASVELGDALDFTLSQVAELLGLSTGWIWLLDDPSSEPYLAATRNLPPVLEENPRLLDGSSYCYCLDTFKKGDFEGAANVNVVSCSRLSGLLKGTDGLKYHASIPLYSGDEDEKKLGVMNVAGPDWRGLSAQDLELLYTIGDLLGIAVERARLFAGSARFGASEERNRLAREIHDTLTQNLTATALQLESAEALLKSGDPAREPLVRALEITRSNLEEARRSVLDLRAAPLEDRPLSEALGEMIEAWESDNEEVSVRLFSVNGARPMPPGVEAALYRVAQESLTNVVRHARGVGRVKVVLTITPKEASLVVQDDGEGCDPDDPAVSARHGVLGMRERMELLGGSLDFESRRGEGVRVEARVPLEGV